MICCIVFSGCNLLNGDSNSHVHNYETLIVQPTCEGNGYTLHICSCGYEYKDTYVLKLGHNYSKNITIDIAPTCTSAGSSSRHCQRCSQKIDETAINPLGHDYSTEWTVLLPTCTESGKKFYQCSRCEARKDVVETEAPLGHNIVSTELYSATCSEEGYTKYNCSRCDGYCNDFMPALGHDYVDGICSRCSTKDPDYHIITARTNDPKSFNARDDRYFATIINFDNETKDFISKNLNDTVRVTVEYELMLSLKNWPFDDWSFYIRGTKKNGGTVYNCKPNGMFSKNTYTTYKFTKDIPAAELVNGYIYFYAGYDGVYIWGDCVMSIRNIKIAIFCLS